jgi:hypothetical protein
VGRAVVLTGNQLPMILPGVSGPEHGQLMILRNGNYFATVAAEHPKDTEIKTCYTMEHFKRII